MKSLIVVSLHACFYAKNFAHRPPRVALPKWHFQGCDLNNSLGKPAPIPSEKLAPSALV